MKNIDICTMVVGMVSTNCYIVTNLSNNEGIVIDPGDEKDKIVDYLKRKNIDLKGVLLTHGHFDHMLDAVGIGKEFSVKVYAHENERELLADSNMNYGNTAGVSYGMEADEYFRSGQTIELAGIKFRVIHTPGHTSGGVCYYCEEEEVLFSGDTLFFECIGRTDLPTGNGQELQDSISEKLFLLPSEVKVYPGHGVPSEIGYECRNNPYVIVGRG